MDGEDRRDSDRRDNEGVAEEWRDNLREALDRMVAEAVPPVLNALLIIYAVLTGAHLVVLPPPLGRTVAGVAGGSALLFLVGRLALRRRTIPDGAGHLAGTLVAFVALANALLHLYLTGEPRQTTNFLLIVFGAGVLLLDLSWFAVVAAASFASWLLVARPYFPDPEWVHFGFSLFFATLLSGAILTVRIRGFAKVEQLRLGERVRQIEMESALVQTERARRGEQDARRALEGAIAQIRESERRFRNLAEATFEGVVVFRDGRILDANTRASELFRVSTPQLLGDRVLNLVHPESQEEVSRIIDREEESGNSGSIEVVGRRYDGSTFPMILSIVEAVHQGEPARVMVLRDVTDQKRAEEVLRRALQEAEANSRAKSSFLANMSHELRTPLNSVIGFANILRKKSGETLPPRETEYLERILSNGEHLLALIEDILDLSKIDADRMELLREPVHLDEVIDEVIGMLDLQARKRGVGLEREVPKGLRPVIADTRRLKQVLLNLVGNALKFTPQGSVRIRVEADESEGRALKIEVIDTGIGIPEGRIEEIFAPFHQIDSSSARSFGGTGLGLTISRSLCDLMGYRLAATSREGVGSTFAIDLDPERSVQTPPSGSPSGLHARAIS